MKEKRFSWASRMRSFGYAGNGLRHFFSKEINAKIHLSCAILVVLAALFLKLNALEWAAILLSIGLVFATEIINSTIEHLADVISPEKKPAIKVVKDMAAAAVLISAIISLVIATLILLPKVLNTMNILI